MQAEIIALLFPEVSAPADGTTPLVTALLRDANGLIEIRRLRPDMSLLRRARIAGRLNCGTPIVDPRTREVIGCEIDPIPAPAF
jgi:hypothetical protein